MLQKMVAGAALAVAYACMQINMALSLVCCVPLLMQRLVSSTAYSMHADQLTDHAAMGVCVQRLDRHDMADWIWCTSQLQCSGGAEALDHIRFGSHQLSALQLDQHCKWIDSTRHISTTINIKVSLSKSTRAYQQASQQAAFTAGQHCTDNTGAKGNLWASCIYICYCPMWFRH